jgi:hypothetical protein
MRRTVSRRSGKRDRLEMGVEAAALLPSYAGLFSDEERRVARRRLIEREFDVDGFLRDRQVRPPAWAQAP